MMNKRMRMMRYRQRRINYEFLSSFVMNMFIVFVIMFVGLIFIAVRASEKNEIEGGRKEVTYESVKEDHNVIVPPANVLPNEEFLESTKPSEEVKNTLGMNWTEEERYMLAKIAMAEAEGESLKTKMFVILTVINRVNSSERYFPDTIEEVIFQKKNGVYQFTPMKKGGRWWTTEPNAECWEAVDAVANLEYDISNGALYFEACRGESWHSRNLEFICQLSNTRFYK